MSSRTEIEIQLVAAVLKSLKSDLEMSGQASLLVSGGSTPKGFFALLSESDFPWEKVDISLVDERFLSNDHQDQNGAMVQRELMRSKAKNARFFPMILNDREDQKNLHLLKETYRDFHQPFSAVVLGMGTDGHTASLFPDAPNIQEGMSLSTKNSLLLTESKSAPYPRITWTRRELLKGKAIFLHYYGEEKKTVLEKAMRVQDELLFPIYGFLNQKHPELKQFWTK